MRWLSESEKGMNLQRPQEDADRAEPEVPVNESGRGNGRDIEKRLSALETYLKYLATKEAVQELKIEIKHLATKEDIQKIKVWVLGGVISGIVFAATLTIGILKLFP